MSPSFVYANNGDVTVIKQLKLAPPPNFTRFMDLPFEIRVIIWRLAMPHPWTWFVWVEADDPNADADSDEEEEEDFFLWHDEHTRSMDALDKELNESLDNLTLFKRDRQGQAQLERYGFHSSRAQPVLRQSAESLTWEYFRTRVTANRSARVRDRDDAYKVPVLLHVCRESRSLLESLGYRLAFSTYTSPARVWFNFKEEILVVPQLTGYDSLEEYGIRDGGSSLLGQCPLNELERLRRVALQSGDYYRYGNPIPDSVHEVVQLCGNLEELLIVDHDWYHDEDDDQPRGDLGDCVVLDTGLEEIWGHYWGWIPSPNGQRHYFEHRQFRHDFQSKSLDHVARDFEEQLRAYPPFAHPMMADPTPRRTSWTTPKVRFVILLSRQDEKRFLESRKKYRVWIEEMYWRKMASAAGLTTALPSYTPPYHGRHDEWYSAGRAALNPDAENAPSAYSIEWAEVEEAVLDMDSWPWTPFTHWNW
jgi:hypothetical protein